MSSLLRKTVSKNKRRLKEDGFDLDLSYINKRLIAMGFPSEAMEGVYRNPFKEVFRFLELKHKDRYKVYNLCSERGYDVSKFHNRVECFPFDDHNAPPLHLISDFCKNVKEWLDQHEENIAVIHCKAGKGRTGLMICSYLLYSKEWNTPQQAMDFYAAMRTYNKKGVTIPSQIRYVHYFGEVVVNRNYALPEPRPLLLKTIQLQTIPKIPHVTDIRFSVYVVKTLVYTFKDTPKLRNIRKLKKTGMRVSKDKAGFVNTSSPNPKDSESDQETVESLLFECPAIPICGDIKMEFYEKETFGSDQKLFSFWFNTSFAVEEAQNSQMYSVEILKEELDKAHKDKQCKIFKENFKVICNFQSLDTNEKPSSSSNETVVTDLQVEEKKESSSSSSSEYGQSASLAVLTDKLDKGEPLNKGIDYNGSPKDGDEIARDLLKQIIEVLINLDAENLGIISDKNDVKELKASFAYKEFLIATSALQKANLLGLSQESRLAFWINTFNLLALHAHIQYSPQLSSFQDYIEFARKAKYQIGSHIYSLLEIEYVILKGKLKIPEHVQQLKLEERNHIGSNDPKWSFGIQKADPRINFLLSVGTVDSPVITIVHSNLIFDQLERATRNFLQNGIQLKEDTKEVLVPEFVLWWHLDFAKTKEKLLKSLAEYLSSDQKNAVSQHYALTIKPYNWTFQYPFTHFLNNTQL